MGHVRDLPKSKLGVDIGEDFEPSYEVIASRKKVLKELKDAAKESDDIFIATDPDREGEAIGWHLAEELGAGNRKKIRRLMFNEITKRGILSALEHPTDHQQADGGRAAGAPRPRSSRRLQDQPHPLGQGSPRPERRTRAVGRAETRLRSRSARSTRSCRKSTGTSPRALLPRCRRSSTRSCRSATARRSRSASQAEADAVLADLEASRLGRRLGDDQGAEEERRSAVHHEQAAAGGAIPGQEDDDDRAAAVRRESSCRAKEPSASSLTCEPIRRASPSRR